MGSKIRKDLVGVVHAYNDGGDVAVLAAGDKVPDGYFVGDHLLKAAKDETEPIPQLNDGDVTAAGADGDDPDAEDAIVGEQSAPDGLPPRAGRGSGKDAWATYAESAGVVIETDWSRDDIIAAVDAAATN